MKKRVQYVQFYQRHVVNIKETFNVKGLVQKPHCEEKTCSNVEKGKAKEPNNWKAQTDKMRVVLVACIVVIGRDDWSGPPDLETYLSVQK